MDGRTDGISIVAAAAKLLLLLLPIKWWYGLSSSHQFCEVEQKTPSCFNFFGKKKEDLVEAPEELLLEAELPMMMVVAFLCSSFYTLRRRCRRPHCRFSSALDGGPLLEFLSRITDVAHNETAFPRSSLSGEICAKVTPRRNAGEDAKPAPLSIQYLAPDSLSLLCILSLLLYTNHFFLQKMESSSGERRRKSINSGYIWQPRKNPLHKQDRVLHTFCGIQQHRDFFLLMRPLLATDVCVCLHAHTLRLRRKFLSYYSYLLLLLRPLSAPALFFRDRRRRLFPRAARRE